MLLHLVEFPGAELARLLEDGVGHAHLAESCMGAARRISSGRVFVPVGGARQDGGIFAHAADVLARLLVAKARGRHQAQDDLFLGVADLGGARAHVAFEALLVLVALQLELAAAQRVGDVDVELVGLEGLDDVAEGAQLEGADGGRVVVDPVSMMKAVPGWDF